MDLETDFRDNSSTAVSGAVYLLEDLLPVVALTFIPDFECSFCTQYACWKPKKQNRKKKEKNNRISTRSSHRHSFNVKRDDFFRVLDTIFYRTDFSEKALRASLVVQYMKSKLEVQDGPSVV